jgi:hypothetical protein
MGQKTLGSKGAVAFEQGAKVGNCINSEARKCINFWVDEG